jgi:protein-L-isoaspartate(D-aspartate) O-methyltransferase
MFDFATARINMVDSQIRPNGITDNRIIDAMSAVKREDFVPDEQRSIAYLDGDVPLVGAVTKRYLIEPMAFARMVQLAEIRESDRVLDVGSATGYGAMVLAKLAGQVVALDSDVNLNAMARTNFNNTVNVSLIESTMSDGAPSAGPFDVILIEGRIENVPEALFSQLTSTGRIVAAYGTNDVAQCCIWTVSGATRTRRSAFDISIAALPGFGKSAIGFAF